MFSDISDIDNCTKSRTLPTSTSKNISDLNKASKRAKGLKSLPPYAVIGSLSRRKGTFYLLADDHRVVFFNTKTPPPNKKESSKTKV